MHNKNLNLVVIIVMLFITSNNYAQKSSIRKDKYSVGIGYGFNSNVEMMVWSFQTIINTIYQTVLL